jgi:multidrug efflux pump subunit AcrB
MAALGITPQDVQNAIQQQNIQAALGSGRGPRRSATIRCSSTPSPPRGSWSRRRSSARSSCAPAPTAASCGSRHRPRRARLRGVLRHSTSYNGKPAAAIAIYQAPGANALAVVKRVRAKLEKLSRASRTASRPMVMYDSTAVRAGLDPGDPVHAGHHRVIVLLVVFVFLQDLRATIVPAVTIPVSLIGVFIVLLAAGFSANTISLFAVVLAIGLVVDDAIVVVENVQRIMLEEGLDRRAATLKAMEQVTGPIISTTLVLFAIFAPVAFLPGISGELFRQFAVTISAAVAISAMNALTLSPVLTSLFLGTPKEAKRGPFKWFNSGLDIPATAMCGGRADCAALRWWPGCSWSLVGVGGGAGCWSGCPPASCPTRIRARCSSTSACRAARPAAHRRGHGAGARDRGKTPGVANVLTSPATACSPARSSSNAGSA